MNELSGRLNVETLSRLISSRQNCRRQKGRIATTLLLSLLLLVMCIPEMCWARVGSLGSDEKDDISSNGPTGDSAEEDTENEYLDDEVRFVTEDDFLYEEDRTHPDSHHQGGRLGGRSPLSHQYERCPPLPDPSAVASSGLCEAKRCQRDDECSRDGSLICCYNGCVYSCLPKVNPPVVFDWVEETDLKYISNEERLLFDPRSGILPTPKALLTAEISPEMIALPGGCYLSSKQYEDLNLFRKFDHIKACSCAKGEVFCEVNHNEASTTLTSPKTTTTTT